MTNNHKISTDALIALGVSLMGVSIVFIFAVNTVIGFALFAVGLGNLAVGLSKRKQK